VQETSPASAVPDGMPVTAAASSASDPADAAKPSRPTDADSHNTAADASAKSGSADGPPSPVEPASEGSSAVLVAGGSTRGPTYAPGGVAESLNSGGRDLGTAGLELPPQGGSFATSLTQFGFLHSRSSPENSGSAGSLEAVGAATLAAADAGVQPAKAGISGDAILGDWNPGRAEWSVSRQQYAGAAGSVLVQELNATSGSTGQTLNESTPTEWGFVLGWALALPPRRMKHQPTIMLVEGDQSVRDTMTVRLVDEGYLVLPAATGRDAVNVLRTPLSPIDVMLLDTQLPDVNSNDLLVRLREVYPKLPAPVWLGDAKIQESTQLRGSTMQHYIPKPIELERLLSTIRTLLS